MTTKAVLTDDEILDLGLTHNVTGPYSFARAIEQAVLKSPEIQRLREAAGQYVGDPRDILGDTGHEAADQLIRRLTSSDPDFDDCTDAAALIRRLVLEEIKGPDGHRTWKDAAVAERALRAASQPAPEIVDLAREGLTVYTRQSTPEHTVCAELVRLSDTISAAMKEQK